MIAFRWLMAGSLLLPAWLPAAAAAQDPDPGAAPATRAMATRQQLEDVARRNGALAAQVRQRLAEGDFRPGDLIRVQVEAESTLTDTFTVSKDRELELPSPARGTLPLKGVLRSELEPKVVEFVGRFVQNARVHAWPLVRISIQGEVARAGVYGIPPDAVIADAFMAAGGTTADADLRKVKIERDGKPLYKGKDVDRALQDRRTVDDAGLTDGDRIIVARRNGTSSENLRFVWMVTSIAGGIYGLTRIF